MIAAEDKNNCDERIVTSSGYSKCISFCDEIFSQFKFL